MRNKNNKNKHIDQFCEDDKNSLEVSVTKNNSVENTDSINEDVYNENDNITENEEKISKLMSINKEMSKANRFLVCSLIVVMIALGVVIGLIVYKNDQINMLNKEIYSKDIVIKNSKNRIDELVDEVKEVDNRLSEVEVQAMNYYAEKNFYEENVVIACMPNKDYHKYGCEKIGKQLMTVCSQSLAEEMKYKKCEKCFPVDESQVDEDK